MKRLTPATIHVSSRPTCCLVNPISLTNSQRLSTAARDAAGQSSKPEWIVDDAMLGVDRVILLDDGRMKFDEHLLSDGRWRHRCAIKMGGGHRHDSSGAAAHDEIAIGDARERIRGSKVRLIDGRWSSASFVQNLVVCFMSLRKER